jgi:hypothetical protein
MPSVLDKGPVASILFEMRTWLRCMLPYTPYVAPFYPTPDTVGGWRSGRVSVVGKASNYP